MRILERLDAVKNADRLVEVLRLADELAVAAGRDAGSRNMRILLTAISSTDQITAIASIHALANIADAATDTVLADLLSSERGFVREHAAWALSARAPHAGALSRLIGLVTAGGFAGMLAQRTLEEWSTTAPALTTVGIESALLGVAEPARRYRLVETLGLVHHPIATDPLLRVAVSDAEDDAVRAAAIAALGERREYTQIPSVLESLIHAGGYLAEVAELALIDFAEPSLPNTAPMSQRREEGLTVAQLFLHADIDPELRHSGSGDNGGVATLLVRLGDALVSQHATESLATDSKGSGPRRMPVGRVLTLSRGSVGEAVQSLATLKQSQSGHLYGRIPLLQESLQSAQAWPLRVAARRGIARILRAAEPVDAIHLRMADVGTLAAFDVARAFDIPVIFTAAPDPHGLINSLDLSGKLTRENFGTSDEEEHFWFRARLVQRLAANSAHTVFLPRPNLREDMHELMGIDVTLEPSRNTIVAEGIDLSITDQATVEASTLAKGGTSSPALTELRSLIEGLPAERQGLPLLISVGRLHRVKGMATVVEAWASTDLRQRTNLLIVGGNLHTPSADEQEQLTRIDRIIEPIHRLHEGLILSGHRPNSVVSRWLAAAHIGMPGLVAPHGVYVCGSLKEEFGLALLEAMASGLLVVAPNGGGPATYIEQGRTGFLTTTWDAALLAESIDEALMCAAGETSGERAEHSRSVIEQRFTIDAMARDLTTIYSNVHHDDVQLRQELVESL
jgi:glycosyltransferase involved in cell wall biosynthesis